MRGGSDTEEVDERALVKPPAYFLLPAVTPREPDPAESPARLPLVTLPSRATVLSRIRVFRASFIALFGEEDELGTRFLFLPVFAGMGVIFYFSLAFEPRWQALLSGLAVLVSLRILARQRQVMAYALTFAIAVVAGMVAAKTETMLRATPMLGADVTTRVTGRIAAMEQNIDGTWRVTLDVLATARPKLRYAPERIRVTARDLPAMADIGSGLSGFVRLRAQSGPVRPGNYDFAFHAYFNGIGANGFFLGTPKSVAVPAPTGYGDRLSLWVSALRQGIGTSIVTNLEGEEGAIAAALISGQRDGISEETNEALRLSGLAHIISISGLHMALAGGLVMLVVRAVAALFPGLAMRHPVKKYAAGAALAASAFYLMLSGADVAAQRSFIMLAVMLVAVMMDRAAITMRNLAIAALITIVFVPHELLGPSFQMSFSATAALIAAFAWWTDRRRNRDEDAPRSSFAARGFLHKMITSVGATAATSAIAGTASGIFALYHFNNTAPLGLLGNVLALPVISVTVMPFAVLSLLAMPFDLEWLPLQVMGAGIEVVKWIAHQVAAISPHANPGIMPVSTLLLWSGGLVLVMFLRTHLRAVSLVIFAAGLVFYVRETGPDLILSDNGRLVALRTSDGTLAINRKQPSKFLIENWSKAYDATGIVKPATNAGEFSPDSFLCEDGVCVAEMRNGQTLAYTDTLQGRSIACAIGDMVILAVAGKNLSCNGEGKTVITLRDLAIKGTLEARLSDPTRSETQLLYAIGPPERPWNLHRLYSRAARGLPEKTLNRERTGRKSSGRTDTLAPGTDQ
ncbi:competence protein [Brucella endophytica]|uniref:Competence protein n=1 Tax=Brucella endophytica TaxID=1963359 RepID=A0A916WAW3_9HYPH|nr:competence protein [Brucella endophytica]